MTVKEIYKRWKSVIHSHVHVSECVCYIIEKYALNWH